MFTEATGYLLMFYCVVGNINIEEVVLSCIIREHNVNQLKYTHYQMRTDLVEGRGEGHI